MTSRRSIAPLMALALQHKDIMRYSCFGVKEGSGEKQRADRRSSSINGQWMPYPEGESSARLRSARDARARRSEQFSHGIETGPFSVVTISVSGVVSMAFAKTGFVLLCTMPSEASPPSNNDLVEMLKDDLAYLASQTRRAIVFELLSDIEAARMEPVLALRISLHRMHVHRLIALIRIINKTASPARRELVGIGS